MWSPSSKGGSRRRRWFSGCRGVLRVVLGEQLLLPLLLREEEEDQRGAEQDRDDPCDVGPLISLQEGRLRGRDDLVLVLRVSLGRVGRAREGLRQLSLDPVRDLVPVGRAGDRRADGGRVAGGENGAENRLHDRSAQIAL